MWDLTIGDPVKVVRANNNGQSTSSSALFVATYEGPSRSYTVGDVCFEKGETRPVGSEQLAEKLSRTKGFQLRLTTKSKVELGRVLTIYEDGPNPALFFDPTDERNKPKYDFVVIAPNGALCSAKEIRPVTDEEKKKLNQTEMDEVMEGRQPYRHKLMLIGKGKWGAVE